MSVVCVTTISLLSLVCRFQLTTQQTTRWWWRWCWWPEVTVCHIACATPSLWVRIVCTLVVVVIFFFFFFCVLLCIQQPYFASCFAITRRRPSEWHYGTYFMQQQQLQKSLPSVRPKGLWCNSHSNRSSSSGLKQQSTFTLIKHKPYTPATSLSE